MDNFIIQKDEKSVIWPHFKTWYTNKKFNNIEDTDVFFGSENNILMSSESIGIFKDRTSLISLEMWNLIYYSNIGFPRCFIIKQEPKNKHWEEFKNWFTVESSITQGMVDWKFYGRDESFGSNGFVITNIIEDVKAPFTMITLDYWYETRHANIKEFKEANSKIRNNSVPEYNGDFEIGDLVFDYDKNEVFVIKAIKYDESWSEFAFFNKYGHSILESDTELLNPKDLVIIKELTNSQQRLISDLINEFTN